MFTQITESVVDVWIIWAGCLSIMFVVLVRGLTKFRWRTIQRFASDEEGASYTLPYVLTLPIAMLVFCLIIQSTLILLVKIGTINAAYAASRSVIVWQSSDPEDSDQGANNARFYSERAAVLAMTPFASGYRDHQTRIFPQMAMQALETNRVPKAGLSVWALDRLFGLYTGAYERLGGLSSEPVGHSPIIRSPNALAKKDYVQNKILFAALATNVEFDASPVAWNGDTKVTVKYVMPMHIPGAARVFASANGGLTSLFPKYFTRELVTTVTLPSEAAQTTDGRLGVPYFPAQTSRYSFDNNSLDGVWDSLF